MKTLYGCAELNGDAGADNWDERRLFWTGPMFTCRATHLECRPEEITEVIQDLMARAAVSREIGNAGRDVIAWSHTLGRWTEQLGSPLARLRDDTYHRASRVDGAFQLKGGA